MILNINKFISNSNTSDKLIFLLVALLPISALVGNLLINLTFISLFFIFTIDVIFNKNYFFLKHITFWIVFFFFITLLVNLYFSMNPINSLLRILKIFLMISFTMQIKQIIQKYPVDFEKIIFGFWSIIFSIVIIDILFEMTFGFNTLGFKSNYPGRIASFSGDELIVGSYFLGLGLLYIGQVSILLSKRKKLLIGIVLMLIFISLLIGERSNFIKFSIATSILLFFITKINFKGAILVITIFSITFFSFLNFNEQIKYRYKTQFLDHDSVKGISSFIKNSLYVAHYDAAFKIFEENPVFGIGVKNYRFEAYKPKYENEKLSRTGSRGSTHPHQIHFEILSETGLFGYISFLILIIFSLYLSIKNYFIYKNVFQLSSAIFIIIFTIPFLPSGSFFSTFPSAVFWINYAIMMAYNKDDLFIKP